MKPAEYNPDLVPLMREVAQAYRRHDNDQFKELLQQAIDMAPHRQDLLFNLANHHVQTGFISGALVLFRQLAETYPRDVDVLTTFAHWLRFDNNIGEAENVRLALSEVRESRADDLGKIWRVIDQRSSQPVSDSVPKFDETIKPVAILTLGYVLNADGSMRQPLIERLEKTLEIADVFPDAPIIVSGGVPRSGKVEAVEMREWLVHHGVLEDRIHEEGYARDGVENVMYARPMLDFLGVGAVIIVTAAHNVRRAGAAMEICARVNGSSFLVPDAVAAGGETLTAFSDNGADKLKLYRDCLRAYGLPMMRTYPHLIEL